MAQDSDSQDSVSQPTGSLHAHVATGRASGKVILFGEHAVVHGSSAIAAGISRGAVARVAKSPHDSIVIDGTRLASDHELFEALRVLRLQFALPCVALELQLDLPKGSGLGSSAAMAVATTRALATLFELTLSQRAVFEAAQRWESVFHGNPSGVDVAAAQSDSIIGFRKGEEPSPLVLGRALRLVIIQAGPPASTKAMVEGVARCKQRNPAQFAKALDGIESIVQNATLLLRQGEHAAVGKLMDLNHMLLAGWMLSTEEIESAVATARAAGALGAKVTGAGGGGCVIALCQDEDSRSEVLRAISSLNMPAFPTNVGTIEEK